MPLQQLYCSLNYNFYAGFLPGRVELTVHHQNYCRGNTKYEVLSDIRHFLELVLGFLCKNRQFY